MFDNVVQYAENRTLVSSLCRECSLSACPSVKVLWTSIPTLCEDNLSKYCTTLQCIAKHWLHVLIEMTFSPGQDQIKMSWGLQIMSVVVYFIQLIGGGWDDGKHCRVMSYLEITAQCTKHSAMAPRHGRHSFVECSWAIRGCRGSAYYLVGGGGTRYIYCCLHHAACSCTDVELLCNCTMCICWILK